MAHMKSPSSEVLMPSFYLLQIEKQLVFYRLNVWRQCLRTLRRKVCCESR
jgi:hypothetical protein